MNRPWQSEPHIHTPPRSQPTDDDRCDLCEEEEVVWSGEAVCWSGFSSWRLCYSCYEALEGDQILCLGCNETMIKGSE